MRLQTFAFLLVAGTIFGSAQNQRLFCCIMRSLGFQHLCWPLTLLSLSVPVNKKEKGRESESPRGGCFLPPGQTQTAAVSTV